MSLFHRHDWNIIDKEVIPPVLTSSAKFNAEGDAVNRMIDLMETRVVYVFKCNCGAVKSERH